MDKLGLTFDDKDLLRRLSKVKSSLRAEAVEKGLKASALYLIGHIKINITLRKLVDTGNLLNSVTLDELVIGSKDSYIMFGPHTIYAAIHEFGGVIKATHAPYLVFVGQDGNLVFTKSVTIPARSYFRPALDEHGKEALDLLGSTVGGIIMREYQE